MSQSVNSQLFITTHSPTLTSKAPLKNLLLLSNGNSYRVSNCFKDREIDKIVQDTNTNKKLSNNDFVHKQKQLERYVDVTRSQLFYSKGILLVEGISEELLIPAFCKLLGYQLEDYRIELVNADGVTFYPFLHLFTATDPAKRLPLRVSVISDDDRFTDAKEYTFNKLCANDYLKLSELSNNIQAASPANRIANIRSSCNAQTQISVNAAVQTFEFEIALSNVADKKDDFETNIFVDFVKRTEGEKFEKIIEFLKTLPNDCLTISEKHNVAVLLWKSLPSKADFAQDFAIRILQHIDKLAEEVDFSKNLTFVVPRYIQNALEHLTKQ